MTTTPTHREAVARIIPSVEELVALPVRDLTRPDDESFYYPMTEDIASAVRALLIERAALPSASDGGEAKPIAWVSLEQLDAHVDPASESFGSFIPIRRKMGGLFTQPLFAHPPKPSEAAAPSPPTKAVTVTEEGVERAALELARRYRNDDPITFDRHVARAALTAALGPVEEGEG